MSICIVGLAGGSGSGKTTLARCLKEFYGEKSDILYQDSYYIDQSHRFDGDGGSVNFDHPDSLEFSLLASHLRDLKKGLSIEVPQYNFAEHKRLNDSIHFVSRPVILLDGILLLSQPEVRKALDLAVYVDTSEEIRFSRRLERDVRERGRTPEGVRKQFEKQVKPMHDQFVEVSKNHADLVLSGDHSVQGHVEKIVNTIKNLSF